MNTDSTLRILYTERLDGGVIIGFNDGKCAVYSAPLLHSVLPQALVLPEDGLEDEPATNVTSISRRSA